MRRPEYIIHVCIRDHLYMVCRKMSTAGQPTIYKTVAECPSMEYALITWRALTKGVK